MTDIVLMKSPAGALVPCDESAREFIARLKAGAGVTARVTRMRNPAFHRKFFAMLGLGFDAWEPNGDAQYKGQPIAKDFDRFRHDLMILAGFYTPVYNVRGEVRLEAKSISFSNMEQEEFERVYSAVANVLLQRVLTKYTREDLDRVVERLLEFV